MSGYTLDDRLLPQIGLLKGRDGRIYRTSHLPPDFVMGRGLVCDGDGLNLAGCQITAEKLVVHVNGLTGFPDRLTVLGDLRVLGILWDEATSLRALRVDGQVRINSCFLPDFARAVWFDTVDMDLRGDFLVEAPRVWLHPFPMTRPAGWTPGSLIPNRRFRWNLRTMARVVKGRIVIGRECWGYSLYDPATDSFEDRPWPLRRVGQSLDQA